MQQTAGGMQFDPGSGSYVNSGTSLPTSQNQSSGGDDLGQLGGGDEAAGLLNMMDDFADAGGYSGGHPGMSGFGLPGGDQKYSGPEDAWGAFNTLCGSPDSFSLEDVGMLILDVGTSMIPFVGSIRSTVEFFTGRNMITGEKLSDFEKWMGLGTAIIGGLGVVAKMAKSAARAGKGAMAARETAQAGKALGRGLGKAGGKGLVGKRAKTVGREMWLGEGLLRNGGHAVGEGAGRTSAHSADNVIEHAAAREADNAAGKSADNMGGSCALSRNSFTGETPVATDKGLQPIEELQVGDKVWAKNPATGEEGYRTITWTTNYTGDKLVQLSIAPMVDSTLAVASERAATEYAADFVAVPSGIVGANRLGSLSGSSKWGSA